MKPTPPPADTADAAGAAASQPAERRLLVLDDDALVGLLIETAARTLGFATRVTARPADFFTVLDEAWQPSHIVLDLTLPGSSGEEVLAELARRGCTARIILSSGVDPERLAACAAAGRAAGLVLAEPLAKPFRVATLRDSLT